MTRRWVLIGVFFLGLGSTASAETALTGALVAAEADLIAARRELVALRERIGKERADLREALAATEEAYLSEEQLIAALERTEDRQYQMSLRTEPEAERRQQNLVRAWSALREARREIEALMLRSGAPRDRLDVLDSLLDRPVSATAEAEARVLLSGAFEAVFERSAFLQRERGPVVFPDGTRRTVQHVLSPGFGGVFLDEETGSVGITASRDGDVPPRAVFSGLSHGQRRAIHHLFSGGDATPGIVLDLANGLAVARLRQQRGWWEFLVAGGPVMVPLAAIALAALLMMIERIVFLGRVHANTDRLLAAILPAVRNKDYTAAEALMSRAGGPIAHVLRTGLARARLGLENLEEVLQETILSQLPVLERFLVSLNVFAAVAPLLGLLGTVTGMIRTFQVITLYGAGNARLLSGGISEALITTEVGLVIAVAVLLAHAWLSRRVRHIVSDMDRCAISLANAIREVNGHGGNA